MVKVEEAEVGKVYLTGKSKARNLVEVVGPHPKNERMIVRTLTFGSKVEVEKDYPLIEIDQDEARTMVEQHRKELKIQGNGSERTKDTISCHEPVQIRSSWTPESIKQLKEKARHSSVKELMDYFGKTRGAIRGMIWRLQKQGEL